MLWCRRSLIALLLSLPALAKAPKPAKPTLTYRPSDPSESQRPYIRTADLTLKDTDYSFRLEFDREPWGPACGMRCASATLFVDTDDQRTTGLRLRDKSAAENGADLLLLVQGVRELQGDGTVDLLRARARRFGEEDSDIEGGAVIAEYDHRRNQDRLVSEGTSVYLLLDSNLGDLPVGPKMRVVYHPVGADAVTGFAPGITGKRTGKVDVYLGGELRDKPRKPPTKKPSDKKGEDKKGEGETAPPREIYQRY